jgi:hypothetical protein
MDNDESKGKKITILANGVLKSIAALVRSPPWEKFSVSIREQSHREELL